MDDRTELETARGLREGRGEAWHALYDAYAEKIWRAVARLMGSDAADVADVVQETFIAAARSARAYDSSRGSLELWLRGIARNQVALHYRKQSRHHRLKQEDWLATGRTEILRWLDGGEQATAAVLAAAELSALVREALTELPADYELLLTAKYLDEASLDEIAAQERSTAAAVSSKLARARKAFREVFLKVSQSSSDSHARGRHES